MAALGRGTYHDLWECYLVASQPWTPSICSPIKIQIIQITSDTFMFWDIDFYKYGTKQEKILDWLVRGNHWQNNRNWQEALDIHTYFQSKVEINPPGGGKGPKHLYFTYSHFFRWGWERRLLVTRVVGRPHLEENMLMSALAIGF